jgi:hypothetical protein
MRNAIMTAVLACGCAFLGFMSSFPIQAVGDIPPQTALAMALGWDAAPNVRAMIPLVIYYLPFMVLIGLNMGLMAADLSVSGVYVFTRYGSRLRWYLKMNAYLFVLALAYTCFFIAVKTALLFAFAGAVGDAAVIAVNFVVTLAASHLLLLLANLTAVFLDVNKAAVASIGGILALILLLVVTAAPAGAARPLFRLNPLAQVNIAWYDGVALQSSFAVPGLTFMFSAIYLSALLALTIAAVWPIIRCMDIKN